MILIRCVQNMEQKKYIDQRMGTCISKKEIKRPGQFNWKQLHLLERMYRDLADRCKSSLITKDVFKTFLNLSGLWGEEIFRKFDKHNHGELDFEDFLEGLNVLVKGSHERQIYCLFQFYDVSKENGIRYDELLKMFYSYSKQELKNLVDDDKFLKTMNEPERKYIFGKDQQLDPLREVIQQSSSSSGQQQQSKVGSKIGGAFRRMTEGHAFFSRKATSEQRIGQTIQVKPKEVTKLKHFQDKQNQHVATFPNKRRGSLHYTLKKTQIKTIPTISLLAKKYAAYLFKQFKLEKEKDSFTYQQFKQLVCTHQKLFLSYFGGFHQYVWEVAEKDVPDYLKMTCWVQGPCVIKDVKNDVAEKRYIKFYRNTLFILRNKTDTLPQKIVNLEGLLVSKYDELKQFGFYIQHRDGLYPERAYLFQSQSIQQQWLIHLSSYMHNSIHEDYNMLDKIGSGNYSVVFKGINKNTHTEVAIKVIEKFKFSVAEKEIIKQQCGILELALHPSIVSFIQKVETKTHLYLVTQLLQDGDLLDYVKRKKFLEQYEAATIMTQLFSALEYLNNSLAIIHRDLKCENIMVKLNKEQDTIQKVKIIDFGFAVYKDVLEKLPMKQRFVGTPNYVAPQILKNQHFNQKVDMFSLGVIMFYILSGELPFDSLFMEEISKCTVECRFTMQGIAWDFVSSEAKDLIKKILCEQDKRITVHQALKHPWLKNKEDLKDNTKRNRTPKYL